MTTFVINLKTEKDKTLFSELAKRLNLKATILSDEDKEDYGLLKAMLKGRTNKYVSKEEVLKALHK